MQKKPFAPRRTPDSPPPPRWATEYVAGDFPPWALTADIIALRLDLETQDLQALVVVRGQPPFEGQIAWPGGFVRWAEDLSGAAAAERELREETGYWPSGELMELGVYDQAGRDPRQFAGHHDPQSGEWRPRGVRIVSRSYVALYREQGLLPPRAGGDARAAKWTSLYSLLPWEDLRSRESRTMIGRITERLYRRAKLSAGDDIASRVREIDRLFSLRSWNEEEVSGRWSLMLEAGLVEEGWRDVWGMRRPDAKKPFFGEAMAFDHRTMLADALAHLRLRIKRDTTVVQSLCPPEFKLSELQTSFEVVAGRLLYRSNFRRAMYNQASLIEPSGRRVYELGPGKPPELFAFKPEAVSRTLNPQLNLPWRPFDEKADEQP